MPKQQDPQVKIEEVLSLHEGAVSRNAPYLIGENQAVHIENMLINEVGAYTTRRGARPFGGRTENANGLGHYTTSTFVERLVGVWGSLLFQSNGSADWVQIASGVSLTDQAPHMFTLCRSGGAVAVAMCSAVQAAATARSKLGLYIVDSNTDTSASITPRCIAPFQGRLFYGDDQILGWSEINALASYSSGNTIAIEPNLYGQITAIVPARDQQSPHMYIFKHDAIFVLSPRWGANGSQIPIAGDALDTINSSVDLLSDGTGCIATKSAIWVPGEESSDVFFLARDGVRSLRRAENDVQAGAGFPLSYAIPDIVDRINWAAADKASAAVIDNAYHLGLPLDGSTTLTHILRYDIFNKAWSLHNWKPRDLHATALGNQLRLFMQNSFRAGDCSVTAADTSATQPFQVYQLYNDSRDPGGSSVVYRADSRGFIFGTFAIKKQWSRLSMMLAAAETTRIQIQRRLDFGPWVDFDNFVLNGGQQTIILGQDGLPWQSSEDILRTKSFGIEDVAPGHVLQIRLSLPTGATEIGRLSVQHMRLDAFPLQDEFLSEI